MWSSVVLGARQSLEVARPHRDRRPALAEVAGEDEDDADRLPHVRYGCMMGNLASVDADLRPAAPTGTGSAMSGECPASREGHTRTLGLSPRPLTVGLLLHLAARPQMDRGNDTRLGGLCLDAFP